MNISSENFGKYRVTRHQNDAVTVMDTATGHASNYPGGWDKYKVLRDEITSVCRSKEETISSMEIALNKALLILA